MPRIPNRPQTEGSTTFDPDKYFETWGDQVLAPLYANNFRAFIGTSFGLKPSDTYGYKATSEVTLLQAQTYLEYGGQGGLHGWYRDEEGKLLDPPPAIDIAAYTAIFHPTTTTSKALTALSSNARKSTLRASISTHLLSLYTPPSPSTLCTIPKLGKSAKNHTNPYLDIWTWSCQILEWAGPTSGTSKIRISHAILPILYHHFGCVVPTFDAMCIIHRFSAGRRIIDLGSGNGYWTFMLRNFDGSKFGLLSSSTTKTKKDSKKTAGLDVVAVDSGLSEWRTLWIGDTVTADGVTFLSSPSTSSADDVLLLVYPQVGDDFTGKILKAYKGDTVICAGTQNSNGFTGFATETIDTWMGRERREFDKVCQVPLPSFAAKDEALFVFQRKF